MSTITRVLAEGGLGDAEPREVDRGKVQTSRSSVAIVLWSGLYGGAETWSLALAKSMTLLGAHCGIVVVGPTGPLAEQAAGSGIETLSLGLRRGSEVLFRGKALASVVNRISSSVAILPSSGYLSAALRLGGYKGSIIAVEHGCLLQLPRLPLLQRALRHADRRSGIWAVDAQVAPSEFMLKHVIRYPHCHVVGCIRLGTSSVPHRSEIGSRVAAKTDSIIVGCAGRLIKGKGLEVALRAIVGTPAHLQIAGDGPERLRLEAAARDLGVADRTTFIGWVADMGAFWRTCDLAVVPSNEWTESFGMVAVEAMACGLPVIASNQGGLREIVVDRETGRLFTPGNSDELRSLVREYAADPGLRDKHGEAGLRRCLAEYNIHRCAAEYLALIEQLVASNPNVN